jgi:protein Tex
MNVFNPITEIAQSLNLQPTQVQTTVSLFDEGATVPFIARYRKDRTGALDEVQIREIETQLKYWRELEDRRKAILKSIEEQGKLTPELAKTLAGVRNKTELEDLYLPFKPRRRTRAQKAREAGLEPLALIMRLQQERMAPSEKAKAFLNEQILDPEAALHGARDILAEEISERAHLREMARDNLRQFGVIATHLARGQNEESSEAAKYRDYFNFTEPVKKIPSHRFLALRRGETEKVLSLKIELEADRLLERMHRALQIQANAWGDQLGLALKDAWERLLQPSLETEILAELKQDADQKAIDIFASNLGELLMSAPFGTRPVLGLDPGLRTGVKCVALSATGQYLEEGVLYLIQNENRAKEGFLKFLHKYQPAAIAIGDGTGSRETEKAVRTWLKEQNSQAVVVRVSESGASIYSASEIARQEFPDLDLTVRGAISIGRRLQDPLAELVKVEPRSLGVGQYQHDVNQTALADKLGQIVESCVNQVGVELNTASAPLLERVSGLGPKLAREIVTHRDSVGAFQSRKDLRKVKGLGAKTYEQAAGFLRLRGAKNPLDNTGVHPDHYSVVEKMAKDLGVAVAELPKQPTLLQRLDLKQYQAGDVGQHTLKDILLELQKPGRDPREQFEAPTFREDVQELEDVKTDMLFEGRVTNITAFGAFVDIGVHQDGLVHISQLSHKFVKDPHEVIKVGQTLRVQVLDVDYKRRRIQLTAKL